MKSSRLALVSFASCAIVAAVSGAVVPAGNFVTGAVFGRAQPVPGGEGAAMALAAEGRWLYAGIGGRIVVFDISEPFAPKRLGAVDGLGVVRQVVAQNGFVYATARESGLWIVDATDPAHPRIRSRFDTCELATGIDVAGSVAFVGQRQNGVEFIDVTNPDKPAHIAMRKTDESQSVIYRDGHVYSGEWGTGHVTVFDARDMRNIRQIAKVPVRGFGDGIWKRGNILYAATGHHSLHRDTAELPYPPFDSKELRTFYGQIGARAGCGHGLDIFDVSDPAAPRCIGRADYPPFFSRGLDMWTVRTSAASKTVFAVQSHNGLFAVDCTDPAKPRVLDRWTFPMKNRPTLPGTCLGSLVVGAGCVYVAGIDCGLAVIPAKGAAAERIERGAPPAHPEFRETYPTDTAAFHVWKSERPGQARAVAVAGDVVYAACGDAGLHVLRILPEGGFAKIGELPGRDTVFDVQVVSNRMYTAEGLAGWAEYERTSPTTFRELRRRPWLDDRHDPAFWVWKPCANRIVLSTRRGGVFVFADGDWPTGRFVAKAGMCPGWDKYLMDAPVANGRWIAYNSANSCIMWIDLVNDRVVKSDPQHRTTLSHGLGRFDDTRALMTLPGGYCFVPAGMVAPADGGPWPTRPFPGKRMEGIPRVSRGGRVVLTCRIKRQIGLWDFATPATPRFVNAWTVSGNPEQAVFHGEKFIVPCGHQGVIMQK